MTALQLRPPGEELTESGQAWTGPSIEHLNDVLDFVERATERQTLKPEAAAAAFEGQRKAKPLTVLLNTAAAWLRELPADVQPRMLCARFPRIANALFAAWPDPDRMHGYFDELLVDRRGGRQGFPKDVLHELLVLRSYYERFHPNLQSPWQQAR